MTKDTMKRDMELIRKILFELEKRSFKPEWDLILIDGYSQETISYHLMIMNSAGLIEAIDHSTGDGYLFLPKWITWQGHEFLDAIRDDTRWNKTKNAMSNIGGFAFEVTKAVAIDLMKRQVQQYLL